MGWKQSTCLLLAAFALHATQVQAEFVITEWQYNGSEFIEFTNVGTSSLDLAGWSFDDDSRTPNTVDLSPFGVVQAGESVILAELTAAEFRTEWSLPASVKIIGENATNFGRNDEINVYDALDGLADRLNYGDNADDTLGSIRTQDISGNPKTLAALGANDVFQWVLSSAGDRYGSYASASGFIGNPGTYVDAAVVPEPASILLLMTAAVALGIRKR
jgi:predicted extracellular nuclease